MYQGGGDYVSIAMRCINSYQKWLWGDFAKIVKTHMYDDMDELKKNIIDEL